MVVKWEPHSKATSAWTGSVFGTITQWNWKRMTCCWVKRSDISIDIIPAACGLRQSCGVEGRGGEGGASVRDWLEISEKCWTPGMHWLNCAHDFIQSNFQNLTGWFLQDWFDWHQRDFSSCFRTNSWPVWRVPHPVSLSRMKHEWGEKSHLGRTVCLFCFVLFDYLYQHFSISNNHRFNFASNGQIIYHPHALCVSW